MAFAESDIAYFDIYPPIAIARVGDSEEWYIGPEVPGVEPLPENGFRDAKHKIKRCAARFRVYAFDKNDKVLGEITHDKYEIKWSVHVANKKSAWVRFRGQYEKEEWRLRNPTVQPWPVKDGKEVHSFAHCDTRDKLIIDSGLQTISGKTAAAVDLEGKFWGSKEHPRKVQLGELHTDASGRLIVVAGDGHAYQLDSSTKKPEDQPFMLGEFDNDDWVESMFDGHVFVEAKVGGKFQKAKNRATILSAPPHFAHGFQSPTNLYELVQEVYERQKRNAQGAQYNVGPVNYYEHIDPLFRRMYLNSFANFRANEGHGPNKASFWIDNPNLMDPKPVDPTLRKYILDRVRAPVVKELPEQLPTAERPEAKVEPKNLALREKEADAYYMPRLGGNDGDSVEQRNDANGPDKWTSLTQLQYDRLAKWANGDFATGTKPKIYESFDKIPLQEQPLALRFAALEWSIGAPLYPGIECYWVAEFGEMYDLKQPFRFGEKAKPGDLTRGLALPWHADFYMCNTHWWPSVRPDNVVTEEYFNKVKNDFQLEPSRIVTNLTKRSMWDDGLDKHLELKELDDRYGNSEMVRKWFKLGFISKVEYGPEAAKKPIAIEVDRYPGFSRVAEPSFDPVPAPGLQ